MLDRQPAIQFSAPRQLRAQPVRVVGFDVGGAGAVRELCDLILCAQGYYVCYFKAALQT